MVKRDEKVTVVGSGLSPSGITSTDQYMISMCRYNKVIEVDVNNLTVTAEAGCTIVHLNDVVLPSNGMALSNMGSVSGQTIGGMLATASHGTGANFGTFSSHVICATLLMTDGSIVECTRQKNGELFLAVCCHLGIVGIVLNLTLQCEPSFNLHQRQLPCSLTGLLEALDDHIYSTEHFRFIWFPHTDCAVAIKTDRTRRKVTQQTSWFWRKFIGYYVLEFFVWLSSFFPSSLPLINKAFYKIFHHRPSERVDRSDKVFTIDCLFKQYVSEWAIPRRHTVTILTAMKNFLDQHPQVKAHFPVEVRFVRKDDALLSPSGDYDVTYIGIISYRPYGKDVEHLEWWNFFEDLAMKHQGKPHWGKTHQAGEKYLKTVYKNYERFMEIRHQLDPQDIFVNSYWKNIFNR